MKYILFLASIAMLAVCGCGKEDACSCGDSAANAIADVQNEADHQPQTSAAADTNTPAAKWYTGKVEWQTIEGGFWLLVADDGQNFDPINLAKDFQQDGLRVRFQVKEKKGMGSFHMRGKIVEIISIQKL